MNKMEEFLNQFGKGSQKTYRSWLKKFFEVIEIESDRYFEDNRDYESDIRKYFESIKFSSIVMFVIPTSATSSATIDTRMDSSLRILRISY